MPRAKYRPPLTAEQQALVLEFQGLAIAIGYKAFLRHPWLRRHYGDRDDFRQQALALLCEAAQRHNPDRGDFAGLVVTIVRRQLYARCMRFELVNKPIKSRTPWLKAHPLTERAAERIRARAEGPTAAEVDEQVRGLLSDRCLTKRDRAALVELCQAA